MARITIKYSSVGTIEVPVEEGELFSSLFQRCASFVQEDLSNTIAVTDGRVLKNNDPVFDSDEIIIFPALSGG